MLDPLLRKKKKPKRAKKPAVKAIDPHAAEMARRAENQRRAQLGQAAAQKRHQDEMMRREANLRKQRGY